ncbi:3-oxoacyl-ACP reductase FabG [Nocardioides fonticola]|uniref:3-oxoacyl-ACP reductase FabG n=1 Tax=Nocardioides fonticola TaxID=450363 RepID=A0ABP7XAB1_9ACTN
MFTSLEGVRVVVTGGTRGIGRGIAERFEAAGAAVLATGRDFDISTPAGAAALAEAARERLGGVDVLCANAGIFPPAPLATMTEAELDETLDINLKGTILSVQAMLPLLQASGRGRVIVTSSITGPITGLAGWAHYGASKAGQLGFVRSAALELAAHGVTVNAIQPGNILTEGLADLGEEYLASMTASIPLGRLGAVEDIGNAALFLATLEAGFITGQSLVVDGGQVLPESLT